MKAIFHHWKATIGLSALYLLSRLTLLTKLPVFADEAIYIHWAQVGQNEPDKYLLLSMLDGKPPLHNWLIAIFLKIFPDPLLASRFLSVLAGGLLLFFLHKIIVKITQNQNFGNLGVLLGITTPFFIINQRMGLAESLLALFFTSGLYYGLQSQDSDRKKNSILFGVSWGLALWTKTNAIFFAPAYALIPLLARAISNHQSKDLFALYLSKPTQRLIVGGVIGGLIFLTLKFSELFPFLFSRSQDYTFSVSEILSGQWRHVLFQSMPKVGWWIAWYMIPTTILAFFYESKVNKVLLPMAVIYIAPIVLVGKIISARYFFPIAPIFIIMAIMGLKSAQKNKLDRIVVKAMIACSVIWGLAFAGVHIINPDNTWYVADDRRQYLEEWSSGHGIPQVRDFINQRITTHSIIVATEGYFGTLPDGLSIYFDKSPHRDNLSLYGIGQPIIDIPADLFTKANDHEVYVVVNAHRLDIEPDIRIQKVGEFKRPGSGPSLLLLKINAT